MLWSGSETPEHQQVRFRNTRTPAGCEHTPRKTHAKKLFHVTFGTHKKQTLLWSGSETPMPKNSFTSPLQPIKNNALPMRKTWTAAGQNAVRQNAFRYLRLIHIKQKQVSWPAPLAAANTSRLPRSAMEEPMRNTRTAAGFEPMPSKMQSNKMLPVTFGIHWNP